MLEKLTKQQEEKIPHYRNKWLDKIFKYELYKQFNEQDTINAMKMLYKFCGFNEPVVLIGRSPMEVQKIANFFGDNPDILKDGQSFEDLVKQTGVDTNKKLDYIDFSSYINYSDFGWLSFYDYFANETDIISKDLVEKLEMIEGIIEKSFMSVQLDGLCIVSKFPCKIIRNETNDLHNLEGPAIEFEDGYVSYYCRGVFIEPEMFKRLSDKKYTFEDFLKEQNEETKSVALAFYEDKFGGEFVFRFLSKYIKEVDTYTDKKSTEYLKDTVDSMNIGVYTLFKGNIQPIGEIAYVRCYCPSTDRMFFLGVDPLYSNAKDAIASLCQVPRVLKNELVSISRQGEIFSFNFSEKGTDMLKNKKISKEELNNVVSLTGNEYFSKIKFEY